MLGSLRSKRVALATLFGVIISISKSFAPSPIDKALVVFQAMFLELGFLMLGSFGATFVGLIGGLLTALWRAPLSLFTIAFATIYGLLIDALSISFKVRTLEGDVQLYRVVLAVTLSTTIVGLASYYTTVYVVDLLPRNPVLEVGILVAGVISGLIGGYLAGLMWRRALRHVI